MTTAKWKLNGRELGDADVLVRVMPNPSLQVGIRQDLADLHLSTQSRRRIGKDLPRKRFQFTFYGRGTGKWDELETVMGILEDDEVWTLESPDGLDVTLYKSATRAALSTSNLTQNDMDGRGRISLDVDSIVEGVWIADGGTYCEQVAGSFTRNAGPTYTRDDGTNTGSTPLVRLPYQTTGYPRAVKASDYSTDTPPLTSITVIVDPEVGVLVYGDYDFTGYLIPAPTTTGDVGLYEACSSPRSDFLDGDFPATTLDAFGFPAFSATGIERAGGMVILGVFDFTAFTAAGVRRAIASTTFGTFGFDAFTATAVKIAEASSTLNSFGLDTFTANGALLEPLLTEGDEEILTESGETIYAES